MIPKFDADFFSENRKKLLKELGSGALVVLTAYTPLQRAPDYAYKFEQEASFWYLTGIEYAHWRLIIDGASNKTWLVAPEVDAISDLFDGSLSREEAAKISGIKDIIDGVEATQLLARLRKEHTIVHTIAPQVLPPYYDFSPNPAHRTLVKELGQFQVQDCRTELHKLRAIKQPAEIAAIQHAVDITVNGITAALRDLKRMKYEYEFEAKLSYEFRRTGGEGHGFDPIIASGINACTVHYFENNSPLQKKDWLLMDVGARVSHYSADISRSVPLGKPTKREVAIYETVRKIQAEAIAMCRPGQSIKEYHETIEKRMTEELYVLGVIKNDEEMRTYFPYALGHGLGIDVHDAMGRPSVFAENMVMAVEPGIQIPAEGISIRIEDNILITADGPVKLSRKLPADLAKLQALINGS